MNVENFLKTLSYNNKENTKIQFRSWDFFNGFQYWRTKHTEIYKAKVIEITFHKADTIDGLQISVDIDIRKLRDKGVLS